MSVRLKDTIEDSVDKLDGYHRSNLFESIPAWISASGLSKTFTVGGDSNNFYPVVISLSSSKDFPTEISIYKNLGSTTPSISGNHSNGTSSLWLRYEARYTGWDGNGGYVKTLYKSQPYATLVAHATANFQNNGGLVVWLRGGTCEYKIACTNTFTTTIYYETVNIGTSSSTQNIGPLTAVDNGGIYTSTTYIGYGNISGNASTATKLSTARTISLTGSVTGSGTFDGSGNLSIATTTNHSHSYAGSSSAGGAATSANKLNTDKGSATNPVYFSGGVPVACTYSLNATVPSNAKFTDTNTWRGITDSYSGTDSTISLSQKGGKALYDTLVNGYASSAGNADTLDGYHESSFWRNDASNKIWNPSTNIKMTPTSSGQEWSFDFRDKGNNTGSYWQVWDESKTTLLKVDSDSGIVSAPYGFSGSLSGNASTATALTSNAGSTTQPIYFSGGKPVACTYTLGKSVPSNAVFTDTNTWRGITDSYSGTDSTISLSQKGGKALYDALVNGYASSAGSATSAGALTNLTRASQAAWGTLTSANGYKDLGTWNESDGSGGSWSIQSKGGQISMQIDGEYYANEGKNKVLHTGNTYVSNGYGIINGSTITNVSYSSSTGYVASGSISNLNTPSTWSSDGSRLVFDNYSGSASNKPVSVDNANSLVTFFKTKHGTTGQYVSQLAFPDHNRFYFRYAAAGSWSSWNTVAFTSDIPSSLPANGGNADTVDGYHASSLWRSDGGTWNPSANIALNATANGQEWSFDITRNGKTGCYWHVWDSSLGSCLKVDADNGKVTACYSFNCASLQIGGETITFTT